MKLRCSASNRLDYFGDFMLFSPIFKTVRLIRLLLNKGGPVLRIISGSLKGKQLKSFKGYGIRPTSDRVKEALFNIISPVMTEDTRVLDLFSGTGSLGIEALSRGAVSVCFVEKTKSSLNLLRQNIKLCNLTKKAEIMPCDVKKAISKLGEKGRTFDLVFADPPYGKGLIDETFEALSVSGIVKGAIVVAEHPPGEAVRSAYNQLERFDSRKYGGTSLSFFKVGDNN